MALDERLDGGKFDRVVFADGLVRQIGGQGRTAAGAFIEMMIDGAVEILAHHAAMALVTGLGTAGLGFVATLLAIARGRLRRGARCLGWTLQPQHKLDQLFLAQTLKIESAHAPNESAEPIRRKTWVITFYRRDELLNDDPALDSMTT